MFDSSSNSTTSTFTYSGVEESDTTAEFRCVTDFDGQTHQSQPASVSVLSKFMLDILSCFIQLILSSFYGARYFHFSGKGLKSQLIRSEKALFSRF